ncbi:hypothetical protein [Mucilaginibacter polytrichastri]|uniref:Uncharacterized protein n=1 Tax=Mucilaginibacter polytrichastri TaxID=1302689 RepID=A0A1Q5ZS28_9SPHI|nr:hypothetical protein [Mucilaginibacter polytrichastri]OKS84580.1 hypothetical protein RG47T_0012 [Mucilaginibacter polytrichastri]SFT02726.1 hypothetical protein SAMN04487890_108222 [Mucilaginibacter polytrichastri]
MTATDQIKTELKKLANQGVNLFNAMQVEQYPGNMEHHFTNVLKKDYQSFVKTLPVFSQAYQPWYSAAQSVVRQFLPGRIADFTGLYEQPKGRKEVRADNYVIEDYLKKVIVTAGFDKKIVASPSDAIPVFQQQINILNSVFDSLDNVLFKMEQLLQAALLDQELLSARQLAKNQFVRSAGAICGIVLENHLDQICGVHQIKVPKKNLIIKDYNDLLKKHEIYPFETWRYIQHLADLWVLSCRNKKEIPTIEEANALIDGTEKIIKTVF